MKDFNSIANDRGFIGNGTPYFTPAAKDSATFFFGNPVSAKIALSAEVKERKSRRREDFGAVLDVITIPNPPIFTITTDTFIPRTWAMALMGEAGKVSQSAETISDTPVIARLDGFYQLAHEHIDASTFVLKKGTTTIASDHYNLNTSMGLLQITNPSAAAEGDALTASYQTKASNKMVIEGAKVNSFRGKVVIDGVDEVSHQRARLIVANVTLSVDGEFDWFSEDYNTVTMKGACAVGSNGEAPYVVELY